MQKGETCNKDLLDQVLSDDLINMANQYVYTFRY